MTAEELSQAEHAERLRQSRAAFDQLIDHRERWFRLRTTMGYVALLVVPLICALAGFVIVNYRDFDAKVIALACTALVSAIGLLAAAWRVILATAPSELPPLEAEEQDRQAAG
jgi:cytochrome b561